MTPAEEREAERTERIRRWRIVARAIATGQAPAGTTPDDYDWTDDPT
ncbi:hypothetical protein K6U06_06520 [Acidiferrimicrobium sp. IK]|nr:hypothetical protein [Acidiferrimicrobium sp. IK]MCU4184007.1 hypothetical protein [Acidiferrimicrobium sp. IK]